MVDGINKLSTAIVIYHSLDSTSQFLYPFILDSKKLLQLWLKFRQIKQAVFNCFLHISKQIFMFFEFGYLSFFFTSCFHLLQALGVDDDFFYQLLTAHFFKSFHSSFVGHYNKSTTFSPFFMLFQVW